MTKTKPKECPFCGEHDLRLSGPWDMADRRYYQLRLECENCDACMCYDLPYQSFNQKDKEENAAEFMAEELFKKWNRRSGYKLEIEVT